MEADNNIKVFYFEWLFLNNKTISNSEAIEKFNKKYPNLSCIPSRELSIIR